MKRVKPTRTNLGLGIGQMTDQHDGTVTYWPAGKFTPSFTVRVADVSGFSTTKDKISKSFEVTLRVLGGGAELAAVSVGGSAPAKIEEYFRNHPDFVGVQPVPVAPPVSVAEELRKLAELHTAGVLTTNLPRRRQGSCHDPSRDARTVFDDQLQGIGIDHQE